MKEQCIVLFPYNAVNDDELTLEEGQIVAVVSKEVELALILLNRIISKFPILIIIALFLQ